MDYEEKVDALLEAIDRFGPHDLPDVMGEWRGWEEFRDYIVDDAIADGDVRAADDTFVPDHAVAAVRAAISRLQWGDSGDVIAEMLGELISDNPIPPSVMQKTRGV